MSEPKFTQGEMTVEDREERIVIFADHFHAEVASLHCYPEDASDNEQAQRLHEEQLANAHLFAAAGKMYEALRGLIGRHERHDRCSECLHCCEARAALAAAEDR